MKNYANKLKPAQAVTSLPRWRAVVLFVLLMLMLIGLLVRSVHLQVTQQEFLQQQGEARYSRVIEISAHRGKISDRNGTALAISTPVESVWASPKNVKASPAELAELAAVLEMSPRALNERLANVERDFVYLKRQLPPDQTERVVSLDLPGISLIREFRRYYPAGEELAHTLGFTGSDDIGREGLEYLLQEQLAGQPGQQRVIKDRYGRIVEDIGSLQPPRPGKNVTLSLDLNIQHHAFREIKQAVEQHEAEAGSIVVLDSASGEILALANYPSYNPNNLSSLDQKFLRNRAVTDVFEPGSTMKPFTVSSAMELGLVRPDTMIDTEDGVMTVSGRRIRDTHPEETLSVTQIIQKSSNIGSAKIALEMDAMDMWQKLAECGFGETTGTLFPGETAGHLRFATDWRPVEQATISYGHGISVSLLQLARAYTVFANQGEIVPLTLFKRNEEVIRTRVYSPQTVDQMMMMLEKATRPGGTAPQAQIAGYRVAGKTGTAHKLEKGEYVNKYIASFVGVAPASDPRLVVAVMLDEPRGRAYYGGLVAAPVFSQVTEAALQELNIPHDAPLDNVQTAGKLIKEEV